MDKTMKLVIITIDGNLLQVPQGMTVNEADRTV